MKICPKCTIPKDGSEFNKKGNGLQSWCKLCARSNALSWAKTNKDRHNGNSRSWKGSNPTLVSSYRRKQMYGITTDDFERLLTGQGGKCAICDVMLDSSTKVLTPNVDHDHSCCPGSKSCGKCVRGILCGNCNTLIGQAKDSVAILHSATRYLSI